MTESKQQIPFYGEHNVIKYTKKPID